jgi:hypothetical protein
MLHWHHIGVRRRSELTYHRTTEWQQRQTAEELRDARRGTRRKGRLEEGEWYAWDPRPWQAPAPALPQQAHSSTRHHLPLSPTLTHLHSPHSKSLHHLPQIQLPVLAPHGSLMSIMLHAARVLSRTCCCSLWLDPSLCSEAVT